MLQIEIITVGKTKSAWIQEGIDHYRKLLSKFAELKLTAVKEADSGSLTVPQVLAAEGERIGKAFSARTFKLLLDVAGKHYDSASFSGLISHIKLMNSQIQIVVGGAYGLSDELKREHPHHLALSSMTFPHELAIVILLEQLYRACSIEAGSKYHK